MVEDMTRIIGTINENWSGSKRESGCTGRRVCGAVT
jgi:hypothetical protein